MPIFLLACLVEVARVCAVTFAEDGPLQGWIADHLEYA